MMSLPRVTNKLPISRSRMISAALRTSVSRSTVTNFSAGTMNDFTGTIRLSPVEVNCLAMVSEPRWPDAHVSALIGTLYFRMASTSDGMVLAFAMIVTGN
jgi:hypothetical protein